MSHIIRRAALGFGAPGLHRSLARCEPAERGLQVALVVHLLESEVGRGIRRFEEESGCHFRALGREPLGGAVETGAATGGSGVQSAASAAPTPNSTASAAP